ncbi:MAG: hypothetical protein BMS9Abin15_0895 [Gammaproteobacteria bacterium]|nr:MAG: hypothetical protein BMS9Abin15_0895 [Gammaproteobacteria bacterium]
MFDIGFWELLLILIVALLVVGPQRLPGLARTAGLWVGKARHYLVSVKADIDKELAADELKKILEGQNKIRDEFEEIISETKQIGNDVQSEYMIKSQDLDQDKPGTDTIEKPTHDGGQ